MQIERSLKYKEDSKKVFRAPPLPKHVKGTVLKQDGNIDIYVLDLLLPAFLPQKGIPRKVTTHKIQYCKTVYS